MTTDPHMRGYKEVEDLVDLRAVWVGLRRRAGLFAAIAATTFAAVVAFALLSTELYTAETALMIEPKTEVFAYGEDMFPQVAADPQLVDTEVELLRSRAMANRVASRMRKPGGLETVAAPAHGEAGVSTTDFFEKRLADVAANLASLRSNNETFLADDANVDAGVVAAEKIEGLERADPVNGGAVEGAVDALAVAEAASYEISSPQNSAEIDKLLSRLEIQRVGATFLIKIRYSSPSAEQAAAIANAYAEEYILEQLEAQFVALRQANQWIDARLDVLRREVRSAEEAAAQFRAEQGLVDVTGSSFSEQALSGIATELAAARTNLASLQARYNTVRGFVNSNAPIDSISEVMSSPVIGDLRRQQTEITRKRAELNVRYGDRHPELKKVNEEAAELQEQLDHEVRRIVESLRSEVGFAAAQVRSLEQSMIDAQGDLASNNSALVTLLELERDMEATRGVYEALLNRQKELNERDRLADANARIIARAEPPDTPSKPRKKLLFAGGFIIALLLGGATSFAAEALDTRIKNTHDIRREFGSAAPVVLIPRIQSRLLFRQRQSDDVARKYVFDEPDSTFAEALRDLRMHLKAAERGIEGAVSVAFTSVFKGEGKSTTAFSFASLLAQNGRRVAFIDSAGGSHRFFNPTHPADELRDADAEPKYLTVRADADDRGNGDGPPASEAAAGGDHQADTFGKINELRGKQIAPRVVGGPPETYVAKPSDKKCGVVMLEFEGGARPFDDFDMNAFDQSLEKVRHDFDYIVIDAPAVLSKPEASVIAAAADFAVLVTEWCVTTRGAACASVQRLMDSRAQLLSFVIAKVDEKQRYYFRPEDRQFYFKKAQ